MAVLDAVTGHYQLPELPYGITARSIPDADFELLYAAFPDLPRDAFQSPAACVTCRGERSFKWWGETLNGNREVLSYDCPCPDQWTLLITFTQANIGRRYQRLGWRDTDSVEEPARDAVIHYLIDATQARIRAGEGVIFTGDRGNGKTMLASLLLKGLLSMGYDGYFTTFSSLIDTFTGAWHSPETKRLFHNRIVNAGILVIDDIGKEFRTKVSMSLAEATLDSVLRQRVHNSRPTIITTNMSIKDLSSGYGGGVFSLLTETCEPVEMVGTDYREQARSRSAQEIELGLTRPLVIG